MGGVVRIAKGLFSGGSSGGSGGIFESTVGSVASQIPKPKEVLENEVEAPPVLEAVEEETKTLLNKKKKGRYNTILSGKEGSLGAANVERKSLLGN